MKTNKVRIKIDCVLQLDEPVDSVPWLNPQRLMDELATGLAEMKAPPGSILPGAKIGISLIRPKKT